MQKRITTTRTVMFAAFVLGACKGSPPAPEHHHDHHQHEDHANHQPAVEEEVGPKIETGSFSLAVVPTQSTYAVGRAGELEIALESRGGWHVNQEYPIRVDLKATRGVALPRAELVKDDAKELDETKVRFLAAVQPSTAGTHDVSCDVSFALCTEENCVLEKRTVAIALEVQ